jgi:hypothetical protein
MNVSRSPCSTSAVSAASNTAATAVFQIVGFWPVPSPL